MRTNLGLRQLESIVAIADHGSFNGAAEHLHVSQPALSRTIRLAEETLGAKLFDRNSRNVTLTPAGLELLPIARRILLEFSGSMSDLAHFMEGRRGRVRFSTLSSTARSFLGEVVAVFHATYPDIEFLIRVEPAETVLELLESHEIDMALTVQPPSDGRFVYRHLYEDEYVLVCRTDDPLAKQTPAGSSLTWQIFENRPFIASGKASNNRQATDNAFMRAGIVIRPAHEVASNDLSVVAGLVEAGLGVTVLAASALPSLNRPLLTSRRLTQPVMKRKIGIVTRAGRTLSVQANRFLEHVVLYAAQKSKGKGKK